MKTKTQHTPTPWIQEGRQVKGGEYQAESIDVSLSGKSGNVKMTTAHRVYFRCLHEEDAEFIVRAVNSHEALLEAAKSFLGVSPSDNYDLGYQENREVLAKVIAQAEGGK